MVKLLKIHNNLFKKTTHSRQMTNFSNFWDNLQLVRVQISLKVNAASIYSSFITKLWFLFKMGCNKVSVVIDFFFLNSFVIPNKIKNKQTNKNKNKSKQNKTKTVFEKTIPLSAEYFMGCISIAI